LKAEAKVTKIKDTVRTALQKSLKGLFINTRFIGQDTLAQIKSSCVFILDGFIRRQVIIGREVNSVVQSTIDPREVDVTVSIRPTFDVNFIFIDFRVTL
jgi:hypothetical protein